MAYMSPRWSAEITDCSVPLSLDQYSSCSYRCLYCFSFYQKAVGRAKRKYLKKKVESVDVDAVKRIFTDPDSSQFGPYVKRRLVMQWGGLADPFDENERELGVGLELLKFFREIEYPITFSTKGTWWVDDERYMDVWRGADFWNLKVSIITLNEEMARKIEVGVPSPQDRLRVIEKMSNMGIGGVTLRLRPFIIGVSDETYLDLIREAAARGATAASTEFLCFEMRSALAKRRYEIMGRQAGYDLLKFYRKYSPGQTGYLRLNKAIKRPYFERMAELCDKLNIRLHISDAHFKEWGCSGSCCGLPDTWNYSRGQFTEALMIAKRKGRVHFSDIEPYLDYADTFLWRNAAGFNTGSAETRSRVYNYTMKDWIRWIWNNPRSGKSPYKYFGGVLYPIGKDEKGDVIYEYRGDKPPSDPCSK